MDKWEGLGLPGEEVPALHNAKRKVWPGEEAFPILRPLMFPWDPNPSTLFFVFLSLWPRYYCKCLAFLLNFHFLFFSVVLGNSLTGGPRPNLVTSLEALSFYFRDSEKVPLTFNPLSFPGNFRVRASNFGLKFYVIRPLYISVSERSRTSPWGRKENIGTLNAQS